MQSASTSAPALDISETSTLDRNEDLIEFRPPIRSSPRRHHAAAPLHAADSVSQFILHDSSTKLQGKASVSKISGHSSAAVHDVLIKTKNPRLTHEGVRRVTAPEKSPVIQEAASTAPDPSSSGPSRPKAVASTLKKTKNVSTRLPKKEAKAKAQKDNRQYTPLEYAQKLQEKLAGSKSSYLKDKRIFYTGGDWKNATEGTRKKMDYVCRIIFLNASGSSPSP
jgi:hypothetical protein